MATIHWHIGCSGFHYKEWKAIFYPPKLAAAKWFEYYCTQFNTLELNNTFYRFHGVPQLYKSLYAETKLEELVTQIMQQKQVRQAHIYFNNTWGSSALTNARWLINRVQ